MSELRGIEIDLEVHKAIELERRSFSEPPNEALRRLLKIEGPRPEVRSPAADGRAWSGKGVTLPHGTKLHMEYNGRTYTGTIEDGVWVVEGKRFSSPSAAAGGVGLTKDGKHTSLDGWNYWYVKRPGDGKWIAIRQLRRSSRTL